MPVTLEELAIHIPASIGILEKYELDYYRNGSQTLRNACLEKGLSFAEIDAEIALLQDAENPYPFTLKDLGIERLIDFINGQHHLHEEQLLENIHTDIQRLLNRPPNNETAVLQQLEPLFARLQERLLLHCEKEDKLLFPYMRQIALQHRNKTIRSSLRNKSTIGDAIGILRTEHGEIIHQLEAVRQSTGKFVIPDGASPEYAELMNTLKQFERELHLHLHMENNVLFPRLLGMENNTSTH